MKVPPGPLFHGVRLTFLTQPMILARMASIVGNSGCQLRFMNYKLTLSCLLCLPAWGSELEPIQSWLKRPIIDTNLPLAEVQAYTESRVPLMPEVHTAKQWEQHAERIRRETLERVVFRGQAAKWRNEPAKVEWLDVIEGGPG